MALNDNAVLKLDTGNYFFAPQTTAQPDDLKQVKTPWDNVGHTSLEDVLSNSSEGGEATVLGTLQKRQLRTAYSSRTESFQINLQQWDTESLKFYFGSNAVSIDAGKWLGVPGTPAPTIKAFLAVYNDGANIFALYAPKAEIIRGDDWSLENTEDLSSLPIKITPIQDGTNTWTYAVTPIEKINATTP